MLAGWPRQESLNRSQDVTVPTVSIANRLVSLRCKVSAGWRAPYGKTCSQDRSLVASVKTNTGNPVADPEARDG